MNSKTLTVLGVLTIVVAALAFWSLRGRGRAESPDTPASLASKVFLPGLTEKANDVAMITIKGSGKETVIKKTGADWGLVARGNYPVEFSKVKDAVLSMSDLLIFEPKTSDPAKYAFLGVADPSDAADSTSRLVTFKDAQDKVLGSAVIGSSSAGFGSGPGSSTSYSVAVRRSGEAQAFMAKGPLDPRATLDPDPVTWLKREVLNVEGARVRSVAVTHADGGRVMISKDKKEDRDYKVADIPAGRELKFGGVGAQTAGALAFLNFDDVSPIADIAEGATPTGSAEYRTFDGLVITVDTSTKNGTAWATLAARFEAPPEPEPVPSDQTPPPSTNKPEAEVRKEVQEINDRASKWAYALPPVKIKQVVTTMEDLLKPADQTPVKIDQGAAPAPKPPATQPDGQPVPEINK